MYPSPGKCAISLLALTALVVPASRSARAQATDNTQQQGKQAVHAVLQHVLLIANNPVPKTGQELPANAHWSIGTETPSACPPPPPDGVQPCLRVMYKVPEADVSCE